MTSRLLVGAAFGVVCALGTRSASSQVLWQELGGGMGMGGPQCFLADTIGDVLFISGASTEAGNEVTSPGIFKWDGSQYSPLGCGFNWDCVTPLSNGGLANGGILSLAFWNSELYAGGDIYSINGQPAHYIARWDGDSWQPLAGGLDNVVIRLHGFADGLYATGYFTHADGIEANGLARWDGAAWHSVFDMPNFNFSSSVTNIINDVAWYRNELYVAGNFGSAENRVDLARWDGTNWLSVGNGIRGSFSTVNLLDVHNDLLYIAGGFAQSGQFGPPENPGCGIVTWNGTEWGTLGEGTCGAYNPTIYRTTWIQDTLYVLGRFDRIGGMPAGRLAKWDGTRWCNMLPPNYFYPDIGALGSFRDTLLIGGSFTTAGPDSIDRIAQWVGGNYTTLCSDEVGVLEHEAVGDLVVFPNPATNTITFLGPAGNLNKAVITVFDPLGKIVLNGVLDAQGTVAVGQLAQGAYSAHIRPRNSDRAFVARFIKQ